MANVRHMGQYKGKRLPCQYLLIYFKDFPSKFIINFPLFLVAAHLSPPSVPPPLDQANTEQLRQPSRQRPRKGSIPMRKATVWFL